MAPLWLPITIPVSGRGGLATGTIFSPWFARVSSSAIFVYENPALAKNSSGPEKIQSMRPKSMRPARLVPPGFGCTSACASRVSDLFVSCIKDTEIALPGLRPVNAIGNYCVRQADP